MLIVPIFVPLRRIQVLKVFVKCFPQQTACLLSTKTAATANLATSQKSSFSKLKEEEENKISRKEILLDQMSIVPHPVSRLRLFKFVPLGPDASKREVDLRQKRIELQNWNHDYWSKINQEFNQEKKDYIQNELKNPNKEELSASQSHEELANFYKNFLDRNHSKHIRYNFEWYRKHVSLLWPSFVVSIDRFIARFRPTRPR